jgi:hypothetical protein
MNAEQKKILAIGVVVAGVVIGASFAGSPIISLGTTNRKYKYSKYPMLWDIVLRGEAKTFNDYNYYTSNGLVSRVNAKNTLPFSNKLLTEMTIGEVIGYQNQSRSGKGQLWATGQFQVIPSTLKGMYGKAGLSLSSLYNEKNQQKIADALIDSEGTLPKYLNKKIEDTDANLKKASLDIATIWSSLGIPYSINGRLYNQSYYSKDRASVDTADVQEILRKQRNS